MVLRIRKATKEELNTPIETIKYSLIERYRKMIENKNLKESGVSKSFCSMPLPSGFMIATYHNEDKVEIHSGWRKILWNSYRLKINDILIEVA